MSDVKTRSKDATSGGYLIRIPVDRDLFVRACAAKGAHTDEDRGALLSTTAKMAYNYRCGRVEPRLTRARQIAELLGVAIDDLWPKSGAGRAA